MEIKDKFTKVGLSLILQDIMYKARRNRKFINFTTQNSPAKSARISLPCHSKRPSIVSKAHYIFLLPSCPAEPASDEHPNLILDPTLAVLIIKLLGALLTHWLSLPTPAIAKTVMLGWDTQSEEGGENSKWTAECEMSEARAENSLYIFIVATALIWTITLRKKDAT